MKAPEYRYVDESTEGNVPIEITDGHYKGIVIRYERVVLEEKEENLHFDYDYDIIENPNNITEDQELINFLGDIVVDVLEEEIQELGDDFLRSGEIREEREVN